MNRALFYSKLHPAVVFLYLCLTCAIVLFCMDPVLIVLAILGAVFTSFSYSVSFDRRFIWVLMGLAGLCALGNPVFVRNGKTVLFLVNDHPVTLEAILYGLVSGGMIAAVLCYSRLFSCYMTADRIHTLFGVFSPRLALFFSMTIRFIPRLQEKARSVRLAQRSIGRIREGGMVESIRSGARVFSVMTGWALENGIVTADSMTSRGYGTGRRSSYSLYRFRLRDLSLLIIILVLSAVPICGIAAGWIGYRWYPSIETAAWSLHSASSYIAYGVLSILPTLLRLWEVLTWRRLQSAI